MTGWIKLHRKLLDSPIFQNEKLFKVFGYLKKREHFQSLKHGYIYSWKRIIQRQKCLLETKL
ncbi:hypothetical protein U457_02716 [Staphylococcus aureus W55446]|nr:hypothetical protein U457_02716 [Staphylococcus aureus W55446]